MRCHRTTFAARYAMKTTRDEDRERRYCGARATSARAARSRERRPSTSAMMRETGKNIEDCSYGFVAEQQIAEAHQLVVVAEAKLDAAAARRSARPRRACRSARAAALRNRARRARARATSARRCGRASVGGRQPLERAHRQAFAHGALRQRARARLRARPAARARVRPRAVRRRASP